MATRQRKTRRLFYALWPDAETREKLAAIQAQLDPQTGQPVHPQDLHMTLQFLGSVTSQQLNCVAAAGDSIAAAGPLSLRLDQLGYWAKPKVLWVAPDESPEILQELAKTLGDQLSECGFTPENRRFKPHVTLARKLEQLQGELLLDPIDWRVDTVALVESLSVPRPPRYQPLEQWRLKKY